VTKEVAENMKVVEQTKTNGDEAEAYIMSIFKKDTGKASVSDVTAETPATIPSCLLDLTRCYKYPLHHQRGEK
jgi:hypothetical protein